MTAPLPLDWTIGVVGHGVGAPATWRYMPEKCADHGHPGHTYNERMGRTWCLCGEKVVDGNTVDFAYLGKDGPLSQARPVDRAEDDGKADR